MQNKTLEKIIGKVADKADSENFQFISTGYFSTNFVKVKTNYLEKTGYIIGEITSKEAINPRFEKPEIIRYLHENEENIARHSLYLVGVKSLVLIEGGQVREVDFPPIPGTNVLIAEESEVKIALGLTDEGIEIGNIKGYGISFKIALDKLVRTHISILGQTGSGKSYLTAKIALELLKLKHASSVPTLVSAPIIFDSSGEYSGSYDAGEQKELSSVMYVINSSEHFFPLLNEKYLPLLFDIYDIDEKQESELRPWLSPLPEGSQARPTKEPVQEFFPGYEQKTIKGLMSEFDKERINSTRHLANRLESSIKEFNRLERNEKVAIPYQVLRKMRTLNLKIRKTSVDDEFTDHLSEGLIINLSTHDNYDERQVAMLLFLRQIGEFVKTHRIPKKLILFLDEAHNYAPSIYKSYCKNEILKLAREGRKYGVSLCLISQRPRWVDPTVLSQCGNVFIFRIQNSDDKKHIFDSISLADSIRDMNIAGFGTGEMIVTGDVVNKTINCKVSKMDKTFLQTERKKILDTYRKK